jgi:phosphate/sulfate permease
MDVALVYTLVIILFFAITDLVVGVSNDAINFLNSAVGSKVTSFRNILIIVSIGICIGAVFSNDMMEVARKGIFNPEAFYFDEIMVIFVAVMVVDVIMLNFFNSIGIPTSTTVSIVFELLGAAVGIGMVKSYHNSGNLFNLYPYINSDKALLIILGIFFSIVIAFVVGALVQYITRLFFTFHFEQKPPLMAGIFGGLAMTSIVYFLIFKGLNSLSGFTQNNVFISENLLLLILGALVFFTLFSTFLASNFKINIYKVVVLTGTFSLAIAFAGNDLVNFIGVPLAAYQSFMLWQDSGMPLQDFSMGALSQGVFTSTWVLVLAGLVMVGTLWFSKKARYVLKTSVDLSSQSDTEERFKANYLSRSIVRVGVDISDAVRRMMSQRSVEIIDQRFKLPKVNLAKAKAKELPAFDLIRASVNLVVASLLISMATDRQLPLSTTYITFMVAMGTSMADRAWGRDSAVFRVSGVLKVLGGFFVTAIISFLAAGLLALSIYFIGFQAVVVLSLITFAVLLRSFIKHRRFLKSKQLEEKLRITESKNIKGIIDESTENVVKVLERGHEIFALTVRGLSLNEVKELKLAQKNSERLKEDIERLRNDTFFLIQNLEESSVGVSRVYILILEHLQSISRSLDFISAKGLDHVQNNHKSLRFNQIKELKELENQLKSLFEDVSNIFEKRTFSKISIIFEEQVDLLESVSQKIDRQVARTRKEDANPKNSMLFFSMLLETKELMKTVLDLIALYYKEDRVAREATSKEY